MLEPIREYARDRLAENSETDEAFARHARGFAEIADRAYAEWDTTLGADWLERQERDTGNVRAALRWASRREADLENGSRLAGAVGPVFCALSQLRERDRAGASRHSIRSKPAANRGGAPSLRPLDAP